MEIDTNARGTLNERIEYAFNEDTLKRGSHILSPTILLSDLETICRPYEPILVPDTFMWLKPLMEHGKIHIIEKPTEGEDCLVNAMGFIYQGPRRCPQPPENLYYLYISHTSLAIKYCYAVKKGTLPADRVFKEHIK